MRAKTETAGTKQTAARKVATPWGAAAIVEEASVPQQSGDKRFAAVFQLLETKGGERFVRVAYTTGGTARRGPVTLRARDLERLTKTLAGKPALAEVLNLGASRPARQPTGEPRRQASPG